jgi:hypothetical protein
MVYKHRTYKKRKQQFRRKPTPRKHRGGDPPEIKLAPVDPNNDASTVVNNIEELQNEAPEPNELQNVADLNEPPKTNSWFIITKSNHEFQTAIASAPYLKNIKPHINDYHFKYLLEVLRDFTYADSHKAYIDASLTDWCYVFVFSQLAEWLNKEIQAIQSTKESKGYAFTTKDSEVIIAELTNYINYFDANKTSWDRLNTQFLEVLFDGVQD